MTSSERDELGAMNELMAVEAKRIRQGVGADSVLILCSIQDKNDATMSAMGHAGNYHASLGAAVQFTDEWGDGMEVLTEDGEGDEWVEE